MPGVQKNLDSRNAVRYGHFIVSFVQEGLMTNHLFWRRRMINAGVWQGVFVA
jgi:hypothetical protein